MSYPVVDIFAGPGGLSEGFSSFSQSNGLPLFKTVLSIEKDFDAYRTLRLRSFFRQFDPSYAPVEYWQYVKNEITANDLFELYPKQAHASLQEARCIELGNANDKKITSLISNKISKSAKWVLVGGPPCQAYSLAGRSRMKNMEGFEEDERHFLYLEYLKILADHAPPVFIMENVKGLLSAKNLGERMIAKIISDLQNPRKALKRKKQYLKYKLYSLRENKLPEKCQPEDFVVKCEQFGIPQARHRVLILGILADIRIMPDILSHQDPPSVQQIIGDLPKVRSALSKEKDSLRSWKEVIKSAQSQQWYVERKKNGLLQITEIICKLINNLPNITFSSGSEVISYDGQPEIYSGWYRKDCLNMILNHEARSHMRSDLLRYLFASSYAQFHKKSPKLDQFPRSLLPEHKNIREKLKISFSDRFRVQLVDKPSTTITSHISKDGHYFIHYDPAQCRSLTVREAARLQTFPDNYKFEGNRTSQYHQVGNAVPPLLARQIAEIVYDILEHI